MIFVEKYNEGGELIVGMEAFDLIINFFPIPNLELHRGPLKDFILGELVFLLILLSIDEVGSKFVIGYDGHIDITVRLHYLILYGVK